MYMKKWLTQYRRTVTHHRPLAE